MGCNRCGKCCGPFYLALNEVAKGDEKQIEKWVNLHFCETVKQFRDGREIVTVKIPLPCSNLVQNPDGTTSCKDYGNRPIICKEYMCEEAKK